MPKTLLPLLAGLAVACGSPAPAATRDCPEYRQAGCPAGAPSYDTGIGALLTERCSPCHVAGGIEAAVLLTDYDHASMHPMGIRDQLRSCSMPPLGAPPLSNDERRQILDWLTCGAPR